MKQHLKKYETNIPFEVKSNMKIKLFDYHLTKPLLAYVSSNNNFALWDYERKTCLRSFNANVFEAKDLSKTVTIRQIKFFDKSILESMNRMSVDNQAFEVDKYHAINFNWLVFLAEAKIYFYNYVAEKSESISALMLDNKIPRCFEVVNDQYMAIGCSDGSLKVFEFSTWKVIKTFRSFHTKSINAILTIKNPKDDSPMLIVSSNDGLMTGWKLENDTPTTRFVMLKHGKAIQTANNSQDVSCLSYNPATNCLVSVTESYVRIFLDIRG